LLRNSLYTTTVVDKNEAKITSPKLCHDILVASNELFNQFMMLLLEPVFVGEIGDKISEFVQPIQDMIPEMIADYVPSITDTITNVLHTMLEVMVAAAVNRTSESFNQSVLDSFSKSTYGSVIALPKALGGTLQFVKEKRERKEEKFVDKALWDSDSSAAECTNCRAKFTLIKRRHHCRACGHVFCGDCSPKVKIGEDTQRVCQSCTTKLKAEGKPATVASPKSKRVVIMVKRAGDVEAEPLAVEIERGRGQTVANFKSATAAKLGIDAATSAELMFVEPNNPKFNDNDAKLAEALEGFDEDDFILEVMTKTEMKKMEADIASQTKVTVVSTASETATKATVVSTAPETK